VTGQLRIFAGALFACSAFGQLIPAGMPVPRTSKLPVVFINGFQPICSGASFSSTFGNADQVLQANGEVSLFFDICGVPLVVVLLRAYAMSTASLWTL
jgi:hypothetical protein